jgi:protoporphyrinogen oxidase
MTKVTMTFIKKKSNLYENSVSFTDWTRSQLTENILSN